MVSFQAFSRQCGCSDVERDGITRHTLEHTVTLDFYGLDLIESPGHTVAGFTENVIPLGPAM